MRSTMTHPAKRIVRSLAVALLAAAAVHADPDKKPNLVIFISDDHTAVDSSLYGSEDLRTPHMDRLAAEGMTLDRAFVVSPTCAPSRAALLTGLMPARNGAEANHSAPKPGIKRLPAYFHDLGYEVVAFGKVGHYHQTKDYGFDHCAHTGFHEHAAIPAAMEWLEKRESEKPLCLFVGSNWPHVPWPDDPGGHDPETVKIPPQHVDTPLTRQARARYLAAVTHMDNELGKIYDLSRRKFGNDLFFLHFSDHGAQWPFAKWTLYDDGIRTPMIAIWPGRTKAGSRSDAMVSLVDVLPTLMDVAGGGAPASLDGRSFANVLKGNATKHRDKIHTTHSGDGNFNVYPMRSVRDERWKYILNLKPGFIYQTHLTTKGEEGWDYWDSWVRKAATDPEAAEKVRRHRERPGEELYDLQNDPFEQHNLADDPAHAERLAAMRADVERWMNDQGDKRTVFGEPKLLETR